MQDSNEAKPQWKGNVIFGLINIALVLLCTKLNIIMISAAMIILIVVGIVVAFQSMKEDWREGFKASALGCGVGLLLNLFAGFLYVFNILSGFVEMFKGLIK